MTDVKIENLQKTNDLLGQILYDVRNNEFRVIEIDKEDIWVQTKRVAKVTWNNGKNHEEQVSYQKIKYHYHDIGSKLFFKSGDHKLKKEEILNDTDYSTYAPKISNNVDKRHHEKVNRIKKYEPDNPMTIPEKKKVLASYNFKSAKKKESDFKKNNKNGDYFARVDLDTRFYDGDGYYDGHYYTKIYLSQIPLGETKFLDEDTVVWQINAGLYVEKSGSRFYGRPLSIPIIRNNYLDSGIVIDWRAPIADLYYDNNKTNIKIKSRYIYDHSLMLKRQFKDGKFVDLYVEGHSLYEEGTVDPFLIEIISENKDKHQLTDIIKTIQANQNKIIRRPLKTNIIVQGCAGSGKTMILLHRISFLKYNNPDLNLNAIKVLTPNELFNLHISELAESLELKKIERLPLEKYYIQLLSRFTSDFTIEEEGICSEIEINQGYVNYIYSDDFKLTFEEEYNSWSQQLNNPFKEIDAIKDRYDLNVEVIDKRSDNAKIEEYKKRISILTQKLQNIRATINLKNKKTQQWLNIFNHNKKQAIKVLKSKNVQLYEKRKSLTQGVLKRLIAKVYPNGPIKDILKDIEDNTNKIKRLQKINSVSEYLKDIHSSNKENPNEELFNGEYEIKKLANEIEKLQKDIIYLQSRTLVSENDAIPDEAKQKLLELEQKILLSGESDEIVLQSLKKTLSEIRAKQIFCQLFENLTEQKCAYFSVEPDKTYRFNLYAQLMFCIQHYGGSAKKDEFLFIDEAQDLSLNEYKLLRIANPNVTFNLFGDVNQLIKVDRGIVDWNIIAQEFDMETFYLNENYRNTTEITNFCNEKLNLDAVPIGISGEQVKEFSEIDFIKQLKQRTINNTRIAIIAKDFNNELFADLLRDVKKVTGIIHGGIKPGKITVVSVEEAKGLEFDVVYVFPDGMSRNQKYIAFSRALSELALVNYNTSISSVSNADPVHQKESESV